MRKTKLKLAVEMLIVFGIPCLVFWSFKPLAIIAVIYYLLLKESKFLQRSVRMFVESESLKPRIWEIECNAPRYKGFNLELMNIHQVVNINKRNEKKEIISNLEKTMTYEEFSKETNKYPEQIFVKAIKDLSTGGFYYIFYSAISNMEKEVEERILNPVKNN